MAMNTAYLDATALAGGNLISHIALVDEGGNELTGGDYARQPVSWTAPTDGLIRPSADLVFDVAAGAQVAGWRGYSAATSGINYGGAGFTTENFGSAGTFTLLAAQTFIDHDAA